MTPTSGSCGIYLHCARIEEHAVGRGLDEIALQLAKKARTTEEFPYMPDVGNARDHGCNSPNVDDAGV